MFVGIYVSSQGGKTEEGAADNHNQGAADNHNHGVVLFKNILKCNCRDCYVKFVVSRWKSIECASGVE